MSEPKPRIYFSDGLWRLAFAYNDDSNRSHNYWWRFNKAATYVAKLNAKLKSIAKSNDENC